MLARVFVVGVQAWAPCSDIDQGVFSPCHIIQAEDKDGYIEVEFESFAPPCDRGSTRKVLGSDLRPRFEQETTCADSTALVHLNDASILDNLRHRYQEDDIYTYTASVLLAVNPYKVIGSLYADAQYERYRGKNIGALPPHPFAIADTAKRLMGREKKNQAILISGESGAGKTETAKIVMNYLAYASGTGSAVASAIQARVLKAQPILESFGNAATLRNSNSSRFGKYNKLFFDDAGMLTNAGITTYLLESSRVVAHAEGERTYHVFYEMLGSIPDDELERLHLDRTFPYKLLHSAGKALAGHEKQDVENYRSLREALLAVGFTNQQIDARLQILAGLVHLGDVEAKEQPVADDGEEVEVRLDQQRLEWAAEMLGMDKDELGGTLTKKRIEIRGRDSIHDAPRTTSQFRQALHSFIKAIYKRMFEEIVEMINMSFKDGAAMPDGKSPDTFESQVDNDDQKHIGILDIYGFERLQHNSFEQLCVNLANERLQKVFVDNVLCAEQAVYQREGLPWKALETPDCTPVLDCIVSCFTTLDDFSSRLAKGLEKDATDERYCGKVIGDAARDPRWAQVLRKPMIGAGGGPRKSRFTIMASDEFQVIHYAGVVEYCTNGWLNKNNDRLLPESEDLLAESSNLSVRAFAINDMPTPSGCGKKAPVSFRSISKKYMQDLEALIQTLSKSTMHYIRCFKPNPDKKPGKFKEAMVLDQIVQCGTIELVKIMHDGYPNRCAFNEITERFRGMLPASFQRYGNRTFIEALMLAYEVPSKDWCLGMSRLFLKAGQLQKLEDLRSEGATPPADKLASIVSGIIRKKWKRAIHAVRFSNYVPKLVDQIKVRRAAQALARHALLVSKLAPLLEAAKLRIQERRQRARRRIIGVFRVARLTSAWWREARATRKLRLQKAFRVAMRFWQPSLRWVANARARAQDEENRRQREILRAEEAKKKAQAARKWLEEERRKMEEEKRRMDEERRRAEEEKRMQEERIRQVEEEKRLREEDLQRLAEQREAEHKRKEMEQIAKIEEREGGDPSELAARDEVGATPICHSWAIDAKRLRGNDRSVVSRPFQLALSGPGSAGMTCKMMLYAKALGDNRGGQSFRLSGGQGSLQLKCEHDLSDTHLAPSRLRFSIGLLEGPCPEAVQQKFVQHDFTQNAACSSHDWDFQKAVDNLSQTFVVNVEVSSPTVLSLDEMLTEAAADTRSGTGKSGETKKLNAHAPVFFPQGSRVQPMFDQASSTCQNSPLASAALRHGEKRRRRKLRRLAPQGGEPGESFFRTPASAQQQQQLRLSGMWTRKNSPKLESVPGAGKWQ